MNLPLLKNIPCQGKRVLLRLDLNVPLKEGHILDTSRIDKALPTLSYLLKNRAKVIVMSHLGKPKGKKQSALSLMPVKIYLEKVLKRPLIFASDIKSDKTLALSQTLKEGDMLLLENLRFEKGEKHPEEDPSFAKAIANLGDLFVNDAFGTLHRDHTSITRLPPLFKGKSFIGFLIEKELSALSPLLNIKKRPFYAILGGAKLDSKMPLLKSLISQVDALFIGGAMTFPFWKSQKIAIGDKKVDPDELQRAKNVTRACEEAHVPLFIPDDMAAIKGEDIKVMNQKTGLQSGFLGKDIGPLTIKKWQKALQNGSLIFWNGPLGVFETPPFDEGTHKIATALALSQGDTIIGGGDVVAAVLKTGLSGQFTHLSTGGGACLSLIEKKTLIGLEVIKESRKR